MSGILFAIGYLAFFGCFIWAMEQLGNDWGEVVLLGGAVVFLVFAGFAISMDYHALAALGNGESR